ncbi:hypothetical protein DdX_22398 [Ditylenchus destructor]|uniref:Uncharacterized protein n=1 Tax=Ditylenchus destructor TaxID=166010 RepID=A0AAD4MDM4_9BILA|nr:hypothetical protein DdX_22398 [Ditylenchus destructor]
MQTRSNKIIEPFRLPRRPKRKAHNNGNIYTVSTEIPPNQLDFQIQLILEPVSQASGANETLISTQSEPTQASINETKKNKADVDFTKSEWNRGPWNSGHVNAIAFDQVLYENDATNLLVCKMCSFIVEKRHMKSLQSHRRTHFGHDNLEPLVHEIRERALDVISIDGRPFNTFGTDAMKAYSATCAKIGAAYAREGIEINPNTIVPSRFTLSRLANNLHEEMLKSLEWQEFVTNLRRRGAFTADIGMKRRREFFVLTGSLVKNDFSGLQTSVISVVPIPITMEHTINNIKHVLHEELLQLGFNEEDFTKIFLTTDEGSNVVALVNNQHRCACHVGNTIVKRSTQPYKTLRGQEDIYGTEVRTALNTMNQTLRNLEKFILSAKRHPKIDESVGQFLKTLVPTRWCSQFDLAESFITNIDPIILAVESYGDTQIGTSFAQLVPFMEHIRSYVEVLKPLRHFISDFEMSLQPMLDKLLFRFKHLGSHFHKIMDTTELICEYENEKQLPEQTKDYRPIAKSSDGLISDWHKKPELKPKPGDIIQYDEHQHAALYLGKGVGHIFGEEFKDYDVLFHMKENSQKQMYVKLTKDWTKEKHIHYPRIYNVLESKYSSFSVMEMAKRAKKWVNNFYKNNATHM